MEHSLWCVLCLRIKFCLKDIGVVIAGRVMLISLEFPDLLTEPLDRLLSCFNQAALNSRATMVSVAQVEELRHTWPLRIAHFSLIHFELFAHSWHLHLIEFAAHIPSVFIRIVLHDFYNLPILFRWVTLMTNAFLVRQGLRQFVTAIDFLLGGNRLCRLFTYFVNQVCAI